ncbi:MAG: putative polynucleotide kinase [Prokaryotic dsDNA virus sp.]|nr:MAG: putative polynucleotide kinase [Prokaryotic dsDNA virus sp.]|tara:strand:+ start:145 stop:1089 length:945 start_codon:yes stop_codon:yes gene_type:complete
MLKLIMTVGASSSGKTKWAEEYILEQALQGDPKWVNLNRDDIRFALFNNGVRDWTKYKFNNSNEKRVTKVVDQKAFDASVLQHNIIISDTNLSPAIRGKWESWAEENGYEVEYKYFQESWETLVKRNAQREGGLPESLLWSQYKRFMQQFGTIGGNKIKPYEDCLFLEDTIIVDLDGTVADMTGVRKPFDWDKVHLDKPRQEVIDMVSALALKTGHITFFSGRDGVCYDSSAQWIEDNIITDDLARLGIKWDLYQRSPKDSRKDDIIKYELFDNQVRGKYNVIALFDDRPQVVRMWDLLDIPNIIQVGKYNVEF